MLLTCIVILNSVGLIAVLYQNQQTRKIHMKLNQLAASLAALDTQVATVAASVAALQASPTDVDLPPDAQAALDKLTADVSNLSTEVTPTAPAAPAA